MTGSICTSTLVHTHHTMQQAPPQWYTPITRCTKHLHTGTHPSHDAPSTSALVHTHHMMSKHLHTGTHPSHDAPSTSTLVHTHHTMHQAPPHWHTPITRCTKHLHTGTHTGFNELTQHNALTIPRQMGSYGIRENDCNGMCRVCHVGVSCGCVMWVCQMSALNGCVSWECHVGVSDEYVKWVCQLGVSCGCVRWES